MRGCWPTRVLLFVVCYSAMTSFAMQSGKYVVMTDSSMNTQVCSSNTPSQVLAMCPGGEVQCGMQCLVSSCPYYQFKSSTPIQCELYNQIPSRFKITTNCVGYRLTGSVPAECSFPFTFNGKLYTGCAPGVGCLTVNRTAAVKCTLYSETEVIDDVVKIGAQSVRVQTISGWIIWMKKQVSGLSMSYKWDLRWLWYKHGFGSVNESNYWLGLENVHKLTSSAKYRLRIEMKVESTGEWRSVEYWSFKVGDEATTKYQLNVDGFSGDTGNGLQYVGQPGCNSSIFQNGMMFTTWDAENDSDPSKNCAWCVSGFWYSNCGYVCLTCSTFCATSKIRWIDATDGCPSYVVTEVRMMMKPQ